MEKSTQKLNLFSFIIFQLSLYRGFCSTDNLIHLLIHLLNTFFKHDVNITGNYTAKKNKKKIVMKLINDTKYNRD